MSIYFQRDEVSCEARIFEAVSKSLADFSINLDVLKSLYTVLPTSFTFKREADSFESTSEQVMRFLIDEMHRSKGFPCLLILEKNCWIWNSSKTVAEDENSWCIEYYRHHSCYKHHTGSWCISFTDVPIYSISVLLLSFLLFLWHQMDLLLVCCMPIPWLNQQEVHLHSFLYVWLWNHPWKFVHAY